MTATGDNAINATELKRFIERVETIEEDRKDAVLGIKEVLIEAKAKGFNPKMIRMVVRERAKDKAKADAERLEAETYLAAVGLL